MKKKRGTPEEKKILGDLIHFPILLLISLVFTFGPGLAWVISNKVSWIVAVSGYAVGSTIALVRSSGVPVYPFGTIFSSGTITLHKKNRSELRELLEHRKIAGYAGAAVLVVLVFIVFYPEGRPGLNGLVSIFIYGLMGFLGGYCMFVLSIYTVYFMKKS